MSATSSRRAIADGPPLVVGRDYYVSEFRAEEGEHFPRCPHPWCREEWHGLAITQHMRQMRLRGEVDPDYRYSTDDSPILCPGSLFEGEFTPPTPSENPWDQRMDTSRFTAEMVRLGFRIPSHEEVDAWRAQHEALRNALREVPADAPYRDHVQLQSGQRVGFQNLDGSVYVGVVAEHREDPEGSGQWTITLHGDPSGSSSSP
ncbi:hypothetical protein [Nocardia sp. NPDC019255]|uniref:hypothetical protein n=1 Tax=Nocardia sp. NPDC019255 TaxID=3154591 RepID=UPI0033D2F62A